MQRLKEGRPREDCAQRLGPPAADLLKKPGLEVTVVISQSAVHTRRRSRGLVGMAETAFALQRLRELAQQRRAVAAPRAAVHARERLWF